MLRIKRLKIDRYRNVEPCELTFSDGFNVLVGKNASGKTSLLRLLAMVAQDRVDELDARVKLEIDEDMLPAEPAGEPWDEESVDQRYPALARRFAER